MLPLLGQAVVRKRALKRLLAGHLWVYKSDMDFAGQEAGLVEVLDPKGECFGQALFSPRSQITLRMLAPNTVCVDEDFIVQRFEQALMRRTHLLADLKSYRLIHGEGDLLPGLFVERYEDAFVVQSTCAAAELLEPLCIEWIKERLTPRLIVLNNTTKSRRAEGLELYRKVVHGAEPAEASFVEHGFKYSVNLLEDQKTGSFFDQRDNHGQIGKYALGRGLDAFTYHGGFALNMARTCDSVQAIELSAAAVAKTQMHAEQAGFQHVEVIKADVMKYLPQLIDAGERFDTIVLDPPAFASGKESMGRAIAAYRKLNRFGLSLLKPGGVMLTCSCSGRVTQIDFEKTVAHAARVLRCPIQVLERRGAGSDHPVLMGMPETEYLKAIFVRKL